MKDEWLEENKFKVIGILLLLVVGYLFLTGKLFPMAVTGYPSSPNAILTLSVSQSRFVSNDPNVNNADAYLVTVSLSGAGQSVIYGSKTLQPSDFQSFASGEIPQSAIKLDAYLKNPNTGQCTYPLQQGVVLNHLNPSTVRPCQFLQDGMDVMQQMGNYKSTIDSMGCYYGSDAVYTDATGDRVKYFVCPTGTHTAQGWSLQCNSDRCWYEAFDPITNTYPLTGRLLGDGTCKYYVFSSTPHQVYNPTFTQLITSGSFVFTKVSDGTSKQIDFTVPGTGSALSSDGEVFANWAGNLNLGYQCSDASASVDVLDGNIVSKDAVFAATMARSYFNSQILTANPDSVADDYNNKYQTALNPVASSSPFATATIDYANMSSPQNLVSTVPGPTGAPVFAFEIKAAWLGIYRPVGVPSLTNCNVPSVLQSGSTGAATANVKNIGNATANFVISISCPVATGQLSQTQTLQPGISIPVSFMLQGSGGNQAQNFTCTITATDQGDSTNTASCTASGTLSSSCNKIPQGCELLNMQSCSLYCPATACPTGQTRLGIADATHPCCCETVPVTSCSDGTAVGQCSITQDGYYCDTTGTLVANTQCVHKVCTANETLTSTNDCVCKEGYTRVSAGVCISNPSPPCNVAGIDCTTFAGIVLIGIGAIGGIYYFFFMKKKKKR